MFPVNVFYSHVTIYRKFNDYCYGAIAALTDTGPTQGVPGLPVPSLANPAPCMCIGRHTYTQMRRE